VNWDYVGAHRNQYDAGSWEAAWAVNERLPIALQAELHYPHLPAMLIGDPTEAVHSELIRPVMSRYFELEIDRPLGGALAYPLLTFNDGFFDEPAHAAPGQQRLRVHRGPAP
jgi:hypothetical protein